MRRAFEDFRISSTLGDKGMGMFNMGSLLLEAGRHAEALQAYDKAQQLGYDFPGLRYQRGIALHVLGRRAEAHREFELALTETPVLPRRETVLALKGRVALEMGRVDDAMADLEAALKLDPRHQKARADLGMAVVIQRDYARARTLFEPADRGVAGRAGLLWPRPRQSWIEQQDGGAGRHRERHPPDAGQSHAGGMAQPHQGHALARA